MQSHSREPIAIVGISVLFPESKNAESFWRNILQRKDLITDVPATHWLIEDYYDPDPTAEDKTYGKRGGFLPYVDFDALDWGVPPSLIEATDVTQLLALMVAKECLSDLGDVDSLDKTRMSVIMGVTSAQKLLGHMTSRLQRPIWTKAMRDFGLPESEVQDIAQRIADHYVPWQEATFPGLLGNVVAGRIANRLDLGGTNCVTDAACASAFSAMHMAVNELYLGDSDVVLAGGADTMNDIFMHMCFSKTPALSKSGDVRPFSSRADGTLLGEGVAMFALKRLSDAERDEDDIYALIRGVGSSSDGRSKSVYAPLPQGQAKALRRAYERSNIDVDTVELIEAHGTGTKAGDAAEFEGLCLTFDTERRRQSIALGTVKAQIGHTKATAGSAGLFKVVMGLQSGIFPPTIKVDEPNPKLNIVDSPFYLNTESRPWVRSSTHPRRAGVSSFGFGGSNFHIAVEEYTGKNKAKRPRSTEYELVVFGAESVEDLRQQVLEAQSSEQSIGWIAYSRLTQFSSTAKHRLALVVSDRSDLQSKLQAVLDKGFATEFSMPTGVHYSNAQMKGKVAFLFPGQGAQYVNMGSGVAQTFPAALRAWDASADVDFGETSLHEMVFPIPVFTEEAREEQQRELTKTQWAQPAIGLCSLALLKMVDNLSLKADLVGGHSYGELTALHYAGVLGEKDFIRVSQKRGQLMNEAAKTPGSMTAVKASASKIQPLLDKWQSPVVIANHNSPKQSVLSGSTADIEATERKLEAEAIFAQRLNVATGFHSTVVSSSVRPFSSFLEKIAVQQPKCPVFANTTAKPYPQKKTQIRSLLANQIAKPVLFVDMIEAMYEQGARYFIEVGPKTILSKLTKTILRKKEVTCVALDRPGKSSLFGFLDGISQLVAQGFDLNLEALWDGYTIPTDPSKMPKPKMTISISGANVGKPYPPKGGAAELPKPNPPRKKVMSSEKDKSTTSSPPPPAPSATMNGEWLAAFQAAQQQTAAAHAAYQQAMANAHIAYLQAAQTGLAGLAALAGVTVPQQAPVQGVAPGPMVQPSTTPAMSVPTQPVAAAPIQTAPAAPSWTPAPPVRPAAVVPPLAAEATRSPIVTHHTASAPAPAALDISSLLLDVIAEKTGYPSESLVMSMTLEGDLGIDSIKRVEILSTMQERAPSLPEVDAGAMAKLQTLQQIVDHMHETTGDSPASVEKPTEVATEAEGATISSLLLDVIAEKTGYPSESLVMSMTLEGDLGIDSIKRVEILSTMQERAPSLPEVDAGAMAKLQTLQQIVDHMQGESANFSQAEVSKHISADDLTDEVYIAAPTLPPEEPQVNEIERLALKVVSNNRSSLSHPALWTSKIAILGEEALAAKIAMNLQKAGVSANVVEELSDDFDGVIDLRMLRVKKPEEAMKCAQHVFQTANSIAKDPKVFVVATGLGGDFGFTKLSPIQALSAGVAGIVRTAAQEWPQAHCKVVDVSVHPWKSTTIAEQISQELLTGGPEIDVGISKDGKRWGLSLVPQQPPQDPIPLNDKDVVVVSGGAKGVTAACVLALAKQSNATFVLLGRTELIDDPCPELLEPAQVMRHVIGEAKAQGKILPPASARRAVQRVLSGRAVRSTLRAFSEAQATAEYVSADVSDSQMLERELTKVSRRLGPITGIVHGAGVLADKLISDKSEDDFEWVFNVKVKGMGALLSVVDLASVKLLCFFSSVAARTGNQGQSDYAAANEVLNRSAHALKQAHPHICVKSIGWGPWEGGMVTPELKKHFEGLGVPLIPLALGAKMFVDELRDPQTVEVVIGSAEGLANKRDSQRYALWLQKSSDGHLRDHSIRDRIVVPMVVVTESFAAACRNFRPTLSLNRIRDIQVRQAARIPDIDSGTRFSILVEEKKELGLGELSLSLQTLKGKELYKAVATMSSRPTSSIAAPKKISGEQQKDVYGDVLFHGPDFQVLSKVNALSEEGGEAELAEKPWSDRVPAQDGALQLALLWTKLKINKRSLPMSIDSIEYHSPEQAATCRLVGRESSGLRTRSDAYLLDAQGQITTVMQGITAMVFGDDE